MFKMIIEQIDGIAITDSQGRYIYVNQGWTNCVGYDFKRVKGKYVRDIVPNSQIYDVLKSGKPIYGKLTHHKDGREVFSNYFPIFEDGKIIAGLILVVFNNYKDALDFMKVVSNMKSELNYYKEELRKLQSSKYSIDNIIGKSLSVQNMKVQIHKAANSTSTVLIQGETGSGKELVAHAIHNLSTRSRSPFIKINCAAIPPELAESEFFGYEYGAFTGAKKGGKAGIFEMANHSSLFLDEINQMSYFIQPKILRVLQENEFSRIGGNNIIHVDVRLIAASNTPLEELVNQDKFRSDLFYRLNVLMIRIPPLRERLEDIPLLVDDITKRLNFQLGNHIDGVSEEVKIRLQEYNWPGNIRELQNVVERAMNIQYNGILEWSCFKDYFDEKKLINARDTLFRSKVQFKSIKKDAEKLMIIDALKLFKNNKKKTAEALCISRTMLYKKLKEYGLSNKY
jgi:PAS domain S-box